jgi:hypothetical protein
MKLPWESLERILSPLSPEWLAAILAIVVLVWRLPLILKEFFTHIRENRKNRSAIENQRRKIDLEIAQKIEKKDRRRGPNK